MLNNRSMKVEVVKNLSHTLAYSLVALQEMNLAFKYPTLYWSCACLISDSGASEEVETKSSNYEKMATSIGAIKAEGVNVSLININTSDYGFKPDIANNRILYGLGGLTGINAEIVDVIKRGRPYVNVIDFLMRCPLKKTVMINLIKAGAFDELDNGFGANNNRQMIMAYYISKISEPKKELNLRNLASLIQKSMIPQTYELQIRLFNFNKYIKTNKYDKFYKLDNDCIYFFENFLSEEQDMLEVLNDGSIGVNQKKWDKFYQKSMDPIRQWLKDNQEEVLKAYNSSLFMDMWNKYALGTLSHWEMQALNFYHGQHELATVNKSRYGIKDFHFLPATPEAAYYFRETIPVYKLSRIIGTVIAKNDGKALVTLLTTTGVVTVKFSREYYAMFKKQISQIQPNDKKKVMEKGWFSRGSMIMVTGYRRDDMFIAKTYKNTDSHQLYKIDAVVGDKISIRHERYTVVNSFEEEEEDYEQD